MKTNTLNALRILLCLLLVSPFMMRGEVTETILQPIIQANGDYFGSDVSINENYSFISYSGAVHTSEKGGRVAVFKRNGQDWVESQILHRPSQVCDNVGYTMNHSFGTVIESDDDWFVVGAPLWKSVCGDPSNGKIDGTVFVYKRSGDSYIDYQTLPAPDNFNSQKFGSSLSISGDWLFVGSIGMYQINSSHNRANGTVYIYKYNHDTELWEYKQKIFDNIEQSRAFGSAVAVDGERALVGNAEGHFYYNDLTYYNRGVIYSYILDEGEWILDERFEYHDESLDDVKFGTSLSISGDVAVINAIQPRSASIYHWENGAWEYKQKLENSSESTFAKEVVVDGNYIIVAVESGTVSGGQSTSGYVNLYHYENGEWTLEDVLYPSDAIYAGAFGRSIDLFQGDVIVGSPGNTSTVGRSYIYSDPSNYPLLNADFSSSSMLIEMDDEVTFTDMSVVDNTTITSWSWDFDGDGVEDSNLQNPTYQFQYPGIQKIKLTVSDGNISSTKIKLVTVLSASESMCYSYIPFVGSDDEDMGAAAWNVIDGAGIEPFAVGHELPQPPASILYAYYYLASRDYSNISSTSRGAMHAIDGMYGWPNFYQALQDNGLSAEDITISFGMMTLGNDTEGVNWALNGNKEWRTYLGGNYYIKINGETIIDGDMPHFDMDLEYQLYLQQPGLTDLIAGDTGYADAFDATNSGSSQLAKDLAEAFMLDCDGSKIKFKFSSLQPAHQFEFTGDSRYGGFFDIEQGFLMKECPKGGIGTSISLDNEDVVTILSNSGEIKINSIPPNSSVSVVNLSGTVIYNNNSTSGSYVINNLEKGVYIVIVKSNESELTKKVVVK